MTKITVRQRNGFRLLLHCTYDSALRRTKELQEKEKEEKERARKVAEDGKLNSGLEAFGKWCGDGSKVDNHNHPIMSRMSALAIVKVLMPKVAPTLKLADYTTLKTCTKWLGELAGGTTWVDEMKAMEWRKAMSSIPLHIDS